MNSLILSHWLCTLKTKLGDNIERCKEGAKMNGYHYQKYKDIDMNVMYKYPAKKILIIAPHPDDEIIGCGGTICKHIEEGDDVSVVYLTNGEKSINSCDYFVRKREAQIVAEYMGLNNIFFMELEDGNISVDSNHVNALRNIIYQIKPEVICLPHIKEGHFDHYMSNILLYYVCNNVFLHMKILWYEVWTPIIPNILINITDYIGKKEEVLEKYVSQISQYDYGELVYLSSRYKCLIYKCLLSQQYKEYKYRLNKKLKTKIPWTHYEAYYLMEYGKFISRVGYYIK